MRVGPHPHALALGDFAPRSGRRRWRYYVRAHSTVIVFAAHVAQ